MDTTSAVWGWRLEGRMGRLPYATVGIASWALILAVAVLLVRSPTGARLLAGLVLLLVLTLLSLRWATLRWHDLNLSGWWSVTLLVPYLGFAVSLFLALWPGTPEENDHGSPPPAGRWWPVGVAMAMAGLSFGLSLPTLMALAGDDTVQVDSGDPADAPAAAEATAADARLLAEARTAFAARYLPAAEPKAFAMSTGGAWGVGLGSISPDDAVTAALVDCEGRRPLAAPPCRLIHMNGQGSAP